MELRLTNDAREVRALVEAGFCPVECAIGGESIVDDLAMDHHGPESWREPVSIRAYRDHYAARAGDPRFVVAGSADADACFAVASLAGLLPRPGRAVPAGAAPSVRAALRRDLSALAETIARVDLHPIGLDVPSLPGGDLLLLWNAMTLSRQDALGLQAGVGLWRSLAEADPQMLAPFLSAVRVAGEGFRAAASLDLGRAIALDGVLLVPRSRVPGFSVWYGRDEAAGHVGEPAGWRNPVVLAHHERGRSVTIGCPNEHVARALFGPDGLRHVFPLLEPAGWGGRDAVGGSPRGLMLTPRQAESAARAVAALLRAG